MDEAIFMSDRIVMMTNGPAATIGEILKVPFPHPRDRASMRNSSILNSVTTPSIF